MKEQTICIKYKEYDSYKELNSEEIKLIEKAKEIRVSHAYAPYSHFKVGCALLLDNGEIFWGTNQENAAYPSGLCAERVAVFYAHAHYPQNKIKKIAICAGKEELSEAIPPCGSCRQVLSEFEAHQSEALQIYLIGTKEKVTVFESTFDLLPFIFNSKMLK